MSDEQDFEKAFDIFNRRGGSPMSERNDDYGKYRSGFSEGWKAAISQEIKNLRENIKHLEYQLMEKTSCQCESLKSALAQRAFERDKAQDKLKLAKEIIEELTLVAEVHLDHTFEKIKKLEN